MRNDSRKELITLARQTENLDCWRSVMRSLTQCQQKIIMIVYDRELPTVKEIAARGFLSQQTTSSELMKLKTLELVRAEKLQAKGQRRESLYSLVDQDLILTLQINERKVDGNPQVAR